jgi:hypothetical protein
VYDAGTNASDEARLPAERFGNAGCADRERNLRLSRIASAEGLAVAGIV